MPKVITFNVRGPYDLALTLRVLSRFSPEPVKEISVLQTAVRVDEAPVLAEVRQKKKSPPTLELTGSSSTITSRLKTIVAWMIFADLDLGPFYRLAKKNQALAMITKHLHGLKPMRPASLFEMAVIAITEQQISLAAAYRIRMRVIERFGDSIQGFWAFPSPERLAQAPISDLVACGLSHKKAEYINELAKKITAGLVDLESLKQRPDDEARSYIMAMHGFGRWSADYILIRGLGRPDCVLYDDLAVQTVLGKYLGDGQRMQPAGVQKALEPFAPFRGLAVFYFLAASRL